MPSVNAGRTRRLTAPYAARVALAVVLLPLAVLASLAVHADRRHAQAAASTQYLHAADVTVGSTTYNTMNTAAVAGTLATVVSPTLSSNATWYTFADGTTQVFASNPVPTGATWAIGGSWTFAPYVRRSTADDRAYLRAQIVRIDTDGTATTLATTGATARLDIPQSYTQYTWTYTLAATTLTAGQRFGVRFQIQPDRTGGFATLGFDIAAQASYVTAQITSTPDAPTIGTATPGTSQATVTWTAPASNGGSAVTGYTVTASPGGQTASVGGSTLTANVTGLNNGTAYTFTVTATNAIGTGPPSAASNSVTPAAAPGAPTSVTAVAGNAQADVTWVAPVSNGGSAITGYTVTSSPGGLTASVDGSTLTATVTGLTNGTAYTFTVTASNAVATSAASTPSNSVTPSATPTVPTAPTGASATAGVEQATVTWTAPASNGGSAITGYTVTSSPGGLTASVGGGTLTATVTGLTGGTEYTFTVTATNAIGTSAPSSASNSVTPTVAPTVPGAPTGVSATAGNAAATVSWTAPASNGGSAITGYTVTSSPGGLTASVDGSTLTATVTGLTNGTAYTFTVTATNSVGTSAASLASNSVTPSSAPTVPSAPTGASATAGNTQATVTWTAPASNGGSAITGYTVTSSPGGLTASVDGNTLTAIVTGLTNGTAYTFTVTATNAIGTSAASSASNSVTPTSGQTVPGAPTGAAATAGDTQATVSWSAPASDGGSAIIAYNVVSSPGSFSVSVDGSTFVATVTGLTNGTSYTFTVTATNAIGTGAASAASNAVTPGSVPGAPTGVTATAGNGFALVYWAAPASNGGSAITSYTATSNPGGFNTSVDSASNSASVTGLTNGTSYTFTVTATNAFGTGPASTASNAVTPSPSGWPALPAAAPPAHNSHAAYSADTAACARCHRVHTSTAPRVLYKTWPEENVCYTCHDGSAAPNVMTQFAKTYKMPLTTTAGIHSTSEPRTRDPALFSGANRHIECADCHNPHMAGAGAAGPWSGSTSPGSPHTIGSNYTFGPQQGVWGIAVTNLTAWTAPVFTPTYPITMQYQLCFKCHSSWAYGASPPASPSGGYIQTDQAKEFNTLNAAFHPVEDVGKNPFLKSNGTSYASSLIGGFSPTGRMVCSDCHRSETTPGVTPTDPAGPHGSTQRFILRGQWDRTTGQSGTSSHLCFNCHAWSTYGPGASTLATGFSGDKGNLHGIMVGARNKAYNDNPIVCMDCHVAVPHGYYRDHLIGFTGDGAPYINRPYSGGLTVINTWRASGTWTFDSCGTAMNSCK